MSRAEAQEYQLNSPPTDGISNVTFGPNNFLLVSSWDSSTRLYDVANNHLRAKFDHQDAVLDCSFITATTALAGGLDGQLKMFDFNTHSDRVIGYHQDAIKCVEWNSEVNLAVSDSTVRYRTGRQSSDKEQSATVRRLITAAFPNKKGYVLSSCEGRVAVEYLDPNPEAQKKKYAFKCHRIKEEGMETIYPVNTISFHRRYNTFATGGCDGFVNIWDSENKKRLCQLHRLPTSIASLSFNDDGNMLAIASSYTFELGDKEHPADQIYIRQVSDAETRPKSVS
ncbi:mitotic checkpoint protein BUB3-like [Bolinopsis microptera]|uniref:mitotic checkpoint protein BUB3-like n=1 Tax=Bolinopsis microptera TaxID=2820187 RepID=UPI003078AF53